MSTEHDPAKIASHVEELKHWLGTYKEDIAALKELMLSDTPSLRARQTIAAVLNYQIKKMDLAPDWMPELGMVDDAMVMRTGAAVFAINNMEELAHEQLVLITRLKAQNETVKEILGEEMYEELFQLIRNLIERKIHNRTPEEIFEDEKVRARFLGELERYVGQYEPPEIPEPEPFYRRLLSHMKSKLG